MKMRTALAYVLSATLAVTMMPLSAFADTTNTVTKVLSVTKDGLMPETSLKFKIEDGATWQENQTISIELKNAEFTRTPAEVRGGKVVTSDNASLIELKYLDDNATDGKATSAKITGIGDIDDDSITINFSTYVGDTRTAPANKDIIYLTFPDNALTATGDTGNGVTVTVESAGSDVSEGTYKIATIVSGGTNTTVKGKVETFGYGTGHEAAELMIKEKTVNSLYNGSVHVLKLTLPKNFKWSSKGNVNCLGDIHGTLFATTELTTAVSETENYSEMAVGSYFTTNNGRVLYAALAVNTATKTLETGYFTPIIAVGKDAGTTSVKLDIEDVYSSQGENFSDADDLIIAKSGTDGVTVTTASTVPTIIAGQVRDTDDEFFWTEIIMTETMAGSFIDGHDIYIDLPEDAQIVSRAIDDDAGIRASFDKAKKLDVADRRPNIDVNGVGGHSQVSVSSAGTTTYYTVSYDHGYTLADDTSDITLTVPKNKMSADKSWDTEVANSLVLYIPITVRADFVGDVVAEVSGRDIETTKVTIAKAVAPVTLTTGVTNVANGMQSVPMADITLTEGALGYWGRNAGADTINISLDTGGINMGYAFADADVKVADGDLEVSSQVTYNNDQSMTLKIDGVSEVKAGTLTISGIKLSTGRQLPEGSFDVRITVGQAYGGCETAGKVEKTDELSAPKTDAIVENAQFDDGAFGVEQTVTVVSAPYLNITTAADTSQSGIVAQFDLSGADGATQYTVNGTTYEMDAAAYIDGNNRTMVPIRYVAYALGLKDSDISYDAGSTTATLSGLTNVVRVTTGSNVLRCSNTSNITMDTVAANVSGRLYVPARFIAQSLGAQVSWDQETQTVTITA